MWFGEQYFQFPIGFSTQLEPQQTCLSAAHQHVVLMAEHQAGLHHPSAPGQVCLWNDLQQPHHASSCSYSVKDPSRLSEVGMGAVDQPDPSRPVPPGRSDGGLMGPRGSFAAPQHVDVSKCHRECVHLSVTPYKTQPRIQIILLPLNTLLTSLHVWQGEL